MAFQELYQNDPRWKGNKIGLQDSLTIEQVGCLLTSLTMVINFYGGSETPASVNERMKTSQGFTGAWIKSAKVPDVYGYLGFKRQKWVETPPVVLGEIDAALAAGSLVLVRVDWSADPGIQGHWVIVHQKQGNDYAIWDPWQKAGAANTLVGRYGAIVNSSDAGKVIQEAIWYGKGELPSQPPPPPAQPPRSVPPPPPAGASLKVQTTAVINMRSGPGTGYNIVVAVPATAVLTILETADTARPKVGQQNQWLNVQDNTGNKGFVAAWLVKLA